VTPEAPAETEAEAPEEPTPPPTLHGAPLSESRGQTVVHPHRSEYLALVRTLKDEGFVMCVDLCGVDGLLKPSRPLPDGVVVERFEVVVNLLNMAERRRVRVRVQLPEADPRLPSIYELHPGSEAMERETYDMFGIVFDGHPDLSRILMPDDWEGHPLRKDYGIGRIPVQFKHPGGGR
jgi:NADH-quinone oxidoreductase subunit C